MTTLIRPWADKDLPALANVLVDVHAVDGYPVEGADDPMGWLTLRNLIGAWTAETDGHVVGHVALTEPGPQDDAPRLAAERFGAHPTAVLGRLFVSPRARGKGIAPLLVTTAMNFAATSHRIVVLDVMMKDSKAIRLYERLGWRQLGQFHHQHGNDLREPAIAMFAPFPSAP